MVSVTVSDELTKLKSNFLLLTFDQESSPNCLSSSKWMFYHQEIKRNQTGI